ncbi:MAG: nucleotidyl transferase AbiEii/AbiGii toxin family protein [Myxococcota bacterium]
MLRHRELHLPSHGLLEAFLRRIARDPEAEAFALRGGMLVRHWFPEMGRIARDVDVVCAWPFDPPAVRRKLAGLLARDVGDGVQFAPRFRTDIIWPDTPHPGIRLIAPGRLGGEWDELHADLTFRLPVWPEASVKELRVEGGSPRLALCPPEMLIARKITVTANRGPRAWRPKDLVDLWWMLEHGSPSTRTVGEAVERTLSLAAWRDGPARLAFWQDPMAASSWGRFLRFQPSLRVPRDLARVVGDVRARLQTLGEP